ncbi:MAG TPA: DUF5908 family protein [Gammaproteobacteria bacterium]
MPIEIRELVIRAHVDPGEQRPRLPSAASATPAVSREDDIIRACVQEVLRVLEAKRER